ncbi:MAG: hypothetical protein JWP08_1718, partial [Bryobacterales bacterium]|nr:hypothetical protein [Bryobacterales bacterium]
PRHCNPELGKRICRSRRSGEVAHRGSSPQHGVDALTPVMLHGTPILASRGRLLSQLGDPVMNHDRSRFRAAALHHEEASVRSDIVTGM